MSASLVGSEMCIRDSPEGDPHGAASGTFACFFGPAKIGARCGEALETSCLAGRTGPHLELGFAGSPAGHH
eukprot:14516043-Alexandrium_andersonii.AAC.1